MSVVFLSVDLQHDFATKGGVHYMPRACVPFIQDTLIPYMRLRGCKVAEIVSDYRSNAQGADDATCVPGTWGYESILPVDIKRPAVWVKSAPSPNWIREGAGKADRFPGMPYASPDDFSRWLTKAVGPPSDENEIILIGLVLEICVLSTLQELHYRGYRARVLFEGVDTYIGSAEQKKVLFDTLFPFWGKPAYWEELKAREHGK